MKYSEASSGALSRGRISTQIKLPLIFKYFLKDAKLGKKFLEEAIISANGTYLQSEFYELDSTIIKSKNELFYFLDDFVEVDPEKLGYVARKKSYLLAKGINYG